MMDWNVIFHTQRQNLFSLLGLIAMIVCNLKYKDEIANINCGLLKWLDSLNKKPKKTLHKKKRRLKQKAEESYSEKSVKYYIIAMSLVQFFSGAVMNRVIGKITGTGRYNYFGFAIFAPLIFLIVCLKVKTKPLKTLDIFTPAYALSLVFFKLGCYVTGCCEGCDVDFMFLYPSGFKPLFPSQLLEAAVAVLIFVTLLKIRKKTPCGTMMPIYLMLYSITRFFTEFSRHESNTFFFLKTYHLFCIAGFVIGLAEYFVIKRIGKKDNA